jgi:uncharacterized protein with GYD domain
MAKYVVTYTISNDAKRKEFVEKLESVGLKVFPDQSVNYGSYDVVNNGNLVEFLKKASYSLEANDVVYLFEGNVIPNNQKTIEFQKIK